MVTVQTPIKKHDEILSGSLKFFETELWIKYPIF